MELNPIRAPKHPKHSRIQDQRNDQLIERSHKLVAFSQKAIIRASELLAQSQVAIDTAKGNAIIFKTAHYPPSTRP